MDSVLQDVKLALRSLRRAPSYTVAALLALALAIGANTTLFSLIEATLLRPFPAPQPEHVLMVRETSNQFGDFSVAFPNYVDWREQTRDTFSGMAAFRRDSFNLTGSGEPERVFGRLVGADFFDILGAHPQLGRLFSPSDDVPGAPRTVVLSNALWQRRFASDPRIVGQTITLTGDSYTVIGVLPPGFLFLSPSDLFVPVSLWADMYKQRDDHPGLSVLARSKPGVSLERASAALNGVAERLEKEYPQTNKNNRVATKTLQGWMTQEFRTPLMVLWGAVALVLLIACANVANLSLARAAARGPELAIRAAMGAGRARLMRELLTESVLLAVTGGLLGIVLASFGLDALLPWVPEALRRNANVRIDGGVLAFTLGLSILTGLVFGALPALRASRPDVDALMRDAHATDSRARRRLRSALVVAEIALSLMLLIGAGLLLRSFSNVMGLERGYQTHGVVTLQLSLPAARYKDGVSEIRFEQELRRRLSALPGAKAVAVATAMPLLDDNSTGGFWVDGRERPKPHEGPNAMFYATSPGFLQAMGGHLLRGRDLRETDDFHSPAVLIDDVLARKLFGTEDPLGHHLAFPTETMGDARSAEIVGIYAHMTHYDYDASSRIDAGMIAPFALQAEVTPQYYRGLTAVLRSDADLAQLASAARREVLALDGELPVYDVKTLDDALSEALASRRFSLLLLGLFAGAALLLAAVGVYGVMSYGVVQRTREIGIRMALGAGQQDVLRLVVGDGLRLALTGLGAGLLLAGGLSRVLRGMLYGVSAFDPVAYFGLTITLGFVALLAAWLPARRAARVDPNVALRAE
jgi:putative ABC transport system permease protein